MTAEQRAQDAWADVQAKSSRSHWLLVKPSDDLKTLLYVGSGTGGLAELMQAMSATKGLLYAGLRVRAVDDRGSIQSVRQKFIRISLVPDDLPSMKKAKASQLQAPVDKLFSNTHGTFDIGSLSELQEDIIVKRLQSAAGAHQPNRYEFGGADESFVPGSPSSPRQAQTAPIAPPPQPAQTAPPQAATEATPVIKPPTQEIKSDSEKSPTGPPVPPVTPSTNSIPPAPPSAVVANLESVPIPDIWGRIHDEKDPLSWMLVGYDGKNTSTAKLHKAGTGGLAEFKEQLEDDLVLFGGLRCKAVDDRGSVQSVRSKFIFVTFVGRNVKPVTRAQASTVRGAFEMMMPGAHVSVFVSSPSELSEADFAARLQACAGAHSPNRYEFGGGISVPV